MLLRCVKSGSIDGNNITTRLIYWKIGDFVENADTFIIVICDKGHLGRYFSFRFEKESDTNVS